MKKYIRPLIALIVIVLSFLAAYGVIWTLPKPKDAKSESFSAERVAGNFAAIDSTSSFLASRLAEAGGMPMMLDSTGKRGIAFDFASKDSSAARLLLIARGRTDASIEAELLTQALRYRDLWNQGVRFFIYSDSTDLADNPVFENVGLAICIDAGNPGGFADLYRTSRGNDSIMKLYRTAWLPKSYTLFGTFNSDAPTDKRFDIVAAKVPSMLFTDEGTLGASQEEIVTVGKNIGSLKTVQHYGSQLEPVMKEYLTERKFASASALKSKTDCVVYSSSIDTLTIFSKGKSMIDNSIILLLFCIAFCMAIIRGRLKPGNAIKYTGLFFLFAGFLFAVGLCSIQYGWVDPDDSSFAATAAISFYIVIGLSILFYCLKRKQVAIKSSSNTLRTNAKSTGTAHFACSVLYGDLILCVILSAVAFFLLKDDYFIAEAVILAVLGVILWRVTTLRLFLVLSVASILLYIIPLLNAAAVIVNSTAGAALLAAAICYAFLLIPLTDLYVRRDKAF